jgi:acyl-CoA reductase-like NAD-dependent aldehyde dehydrogenase
MGFEAFCQALRARSFPLDFPGHYIGGEWVQDPRAEVLPGSFNPSRGEGIVKVLVSKKIVESGIDAAENAQRELASWTLEQRIDCLTRIRQVLTDYQDYLVDALSVEAGKPRWEAQADFKSSLQQLDAVLAERDRILEALLGPTRLAYPDIRFRLQPNGMTIAFLPFSTPLATFVQCLAGGLIAASPLVLMPSSHAVLCGALFAYILDKIELPRGAVNIVFGNYQTFSKALSDRRIQAVIYSGSREHCDAIRRDQGAVLGRQLLLQSGGKNSVIVDKAADVKEAVRCVLYGAIKTAGQLNTSTSRAYVHESMMEAFKKEMIRIVRALEIGPTDDKQSPHLGPLYAQKAVDKFLRYQTMAKREATDTWVWGKVYNTGTSGYFVTPGIHYFEQLEASTSYQTNVLMCPDVAIYRYKDVDQAIAAANNTEAALVTSLVGPEGSVEAWAPRLKAPNILINLPTVGLDVNPPVAGRKLCGDFRMNGLGIAFLLTYPQSCRSATGPLQGLEGWPQLD